MNKLANISVFESLQASANERMVSPMSVFNDDDARYPGAFFQVDDDFVSVHNADPALTDGSAKGNGQGQNQKELDAHTMLRNYAWMMQWANKLKGMTQNKRALSRLESLYSLCMQVIDPQKYKKPYASYLKSFVDTLGTYDPRYGAAFDIDELIQKYRPNAAAMKYVFNPAKEKQAALMKAAKQGLKDARKANSQAQQQQTQPQTQQQQIPQGQQQVQQQQVQPQAQSRGNLFQRVGQAVKRGLNGVRGRQSQPAY